MKLKIGWLDEFFGTRSVTGYTAPNKYKVYNQKWIKDRKSLCMNVTSAWVFHPDLEKGIEI